MNLRPRRVPCAPLADPLARSLARPLAALVAALLATLVSVLAAFAADAPAPGVAPVHVVPIDGPIGPATADHIERAFERAARERAQLIVLQMDTPGGLDQAMRGIIKRILGSPVPVAGFVGPQGARAASAGTYIMYATHVAAMAPATNLGAATPIAVGMPSPGGEPRPIERPASGASAPVPGDTAAAKRIHDATAYLRSLAQLRGRDIAWAELAVRESVSLSAQDALARKVIDLMAEDIPDLLRRLDGRTVTVGEAPQRTVKLATANAPVVTVDPGWRGRLLAAISDPSLALVLMMLGIYGLLFEFMNPGFVAPGVVGGVCLLLALWGLQMLPINHAGLGLILLGIAFLVGEAFMPSYGVLGIGGIAAFALGALLLVDTDAPGFEIPLGLVAGLALASAVVVFGVVGLAARARQRPVVSGRQYLVGAPGTVIDFADGEGWAEVMGERWRVRSAAVLHPGQRVRVERIDGLTLDVSVPPGAAEQGRADDKGGVR